MLIFLAKREFQNLFMIKFMVDQIFSINTKLLGIFILW